MKKMPPRFGWHSKGALGMENEIYGQRARFAVYLTNGLLYDRLHTLAAEYSLPVEQLADLAVKRLIDDVDLVRSLRNGKVAGV